MKLVENMRVKLVGGTNIEFTQYLVGTGDGKLPVNRDIGHFKVRIPDDLVAKPCKVEDLCQFVFEDLDMHYQDPAWLCSIICPTNTGVDKVNDMMMSMFPGVVREYLSSDYVEENEH